MDKSSFIEDQKLRQLVRQIEGEKDYGSLYNLKENSLFGELLLILVYAYKYKKKVCLEWFENEENIRRELFYQMLISGKIEIIKWFQSINFEIRNAEISRTFNLATEETFNEITDKFNYPLDLSIRIVKFGRLKLLVWLSKKKNSRYKISTETTVQAAKMNRKKIFIWLMENGYVWRETLDSLLETSFYYLLLLFDNGYKGRKEVNELLESETPEFKEIIRNYEVDINYPSAAINGVNNKDRELIIKFIKLKSIVIYREIINNLSMDDIVFYFNLSNQCKYFYAEILKSRKFKFNIFIQKVDICKR